MNISSPEPSNREETSLENWRIYDPDYRLPPLLDAALGAFVEFGYHGTSVRTIAARANLSVPGLYHHYRSKSDMLALLLDQSGEEVIRRARQALETAENSATSRFTRQVENIVLYMGHRQRLAHLAREMRCLEPAHLRRHVHLRDSLENLMLEEVIGGKALKEFDVADPWAATRAVLVLCRGVADWYSPNGPNTPEEIAAQYVDFALALVRARASS